jgi:hypothetical protein
MWELSFGRRDVQPLIEGHQNTKLRRSGWRGATAAAECQTHYAGVRRPLEGCQSLPQTNSQGCTWRGQSLQQLNPPYKLFRAQQLVVVELYSCGRLGHAREARKPPPGSSGAPAILVCAPPQTCAGLPSMSAPRYIRGSTAASSCSACCECILPPERCGAHEAMGTRSAQKRRGDGSDVSRDPRGSALWYTAHVAVP